jgi:RNA polymerase sigma-70 factor (ECF subfamily)
MEQVLNTDIAWQADLSTDEDAQTLRRIAAGDRQALTALYLRHRVPLYRYLLQLTPDHGLAEELLQDTLVAVWKSARTFEGRSSPRTWLFGVARRQAHNTLRQRALPLTDLAEVELLPATTPEPEDAALAAADRAELAGALRALPAMFREVLVLVFLQEFSYAETAQVLGVPVGTVKSRLNHAKRALRAVLESGPFAKGADR